MSESILPVQISNAMFTAAQAILLGIASWTLERMEKSGKILRWDQGVYLPEHLCPDGRSYAAASALKFPGSIVCLRSAAEFWGLTNEVCNEYFLAIPKDTWRTRAALGNDVDGKRAVKWLRWNDIKMNLDVGKQKEFGVEFKITSPARTVIDYFLYGQGTGKTQIFGRDEVLEVFNNWVESKDQHEINKMQSMAEALGADKFIHPLLEGRRSVLAMRY